MVDLQFYLVDESTGQKTKIDNNLDLGSLFKGTEKKVPIAIYNNGDETAINPKISIMEYVQTGKNYSEAVKWKKLSLSRNADYNTTIQIPNILAKSWMTGKDVYFEDFSKYSTAAGTKPDMNWVLWAGNDEIWEVYSGYLMHNVDSQHSRALWGTLPKAQDFEFSCRITVRDSVYAGYILRDTGDSDTGYIVLVQGQASYLTQNNIPTNEGVIQVFRGKFSSGISSWTLLYQSPSIGARGTHDYFKVKLTDNRFDFWYQNEYSVTPLYSWTDSARTYMNSSKPVLASHPGSGSILVYFDDIKMEVTNANGMLWLDNTVNSKTPAFGEQYSILKVEFGGV